MLVMLRRNETLIKKKLWQYLIPSIMTNMAMQIGNVVDPLLVGRAVPGNKDVHIINASVAAAYDRIFLL